MLRLLLPRACAWLRACPLVADADAAADGPSSLAAVGRLLSTMSGKALAAGIKEQDQLALHRCFLFLLRSSLRTPLMEQFAAAVDGGAPPDERTTAQAVALLAADAHETQRRQEEAAAAAAEASGGRPLPVAVAVPLGSRAAPPALRRAKGAGSARDVVGAAAETAEEKSSAHCDGRCARPW